MLSCSQKSSAFLKKMFGLSVVFYHQISDLGRTAPATEHKWVAKPVYKLCVLVFLNVKLGWSVLSWSCFEDSVEGAGLMFGVQHFTVSPLLPVAAS